MSSNNNNKTQSTLHKDLNLGVVIIFLIVTVLFIFSLTRSNYSKGFFSQRTEIRK